MDNRTENQNRIEDKGEVTGIRPGSEVAKTEKAKPAKTAVRLPVKTLSEEERDAALINRPKAKDVTPLASKKLAPKDIPVFEDTPERREKLELRKKRHFKRKLRDWGIFTGYLTPSFVGVLVFFFLPLLMLLKTSFQGLLLALSLSPSTPLYAPVLGAMFAIFVVKCFFGGLGKNFLNPALAGRCFLLISFGRSMTVFEVDGVASATPVAELAAGKAVNITQMFLGTSSGVIGSSILALLVGGLVLWAMDIIHGQIWVSVLVGFVVFMGLFGGQGFDPQFLLAHLCGGGVIMGAFYMATDYTTSPSSRLGQTVYGVLIGVLGALFRVAGSAADSFSYSIIIGNLFTPLIETYVIPKPFAYRKKAITLQNGEPQLPF